MKTVRWIRAPVDKVKDNRRWSTRRAARPSPGKHAIRRRQQPCLEAVTRTMAVRGREVFRRVPGKISDARTILVLLLATALLPAIF